MKIRFFELSNDLLAIMSTDRVLEEVNGAWTSTLNWPRRALLSRDFIDLVHADDIEVTIAATERFAAGGVTSICNRIRMHAGGYSWIDWRAVFDEETHRIHVIGRDVSSWHAAQEALTRTVADQRRTREDEQQRIAAELHDAALQHAIAALMFAGAAGTTPSCESLDQARQQVQATIEAMRNVMRGLNPLELDDYDLASAIQRLAAEVGAQFSLDVVADVDLDVHVDQHLADIAYRVAREGLINAGKHAGGTRAVVSVRVEGRHMHVTVTDDGCGVTAGETEARAGLGLGLRTLRERALACGGMLEFRRNEHGSALCAYLPLDTSPHEHEAPLSAAAVRGSRD